MLSAPVSFESKEVLNYSNEHNGSSRCLIDQLSKRCFVIELLDKYRLRDARKEVIATIMRCS